MDRRSSAPGPGDSSLGRPATEGFTGAMTGVGLPDIVQMNELQRFTGGVTVEAPEARGRIFFKDGQIIHAECGGTTGAEAFYALMRLPGGRFTLQPRVISAQRTVDKSTSFLLLEAHRLIDEAAAGRPPPASPPGAASSQLGPPRVAGASSSQYGLARPPGASSSFYGPAPGRSPGAASSQLGPAAARAPGVGSSQYGPAGVQPPGAASSQHRPTAARPAAAAPAPATAPAQPPAAGEGPSFSRARKGLLRSPAALAGLAGVCAVIAAVVWHTLAARPAPEPPPLVRVAGADVLEGGVAQALGEAYLGAQRVKDVAASTPRPDALVLAGTLDGQRRKVELQGGGPSAGFEALLAGTADVVLSSRRIYPEERQRLATIGAMTSAASEHVLAVDGLAVIVNKANPIEKLDRAKLSALFSGGITDWAELGVADDEQAEWASVGVQGKGGVVASGVRVYAPAGTSGAYDVFRAMVLTEKPLLASAKRLAGFQAVAEAVAADPGAIGFVPLPFVGPARAVPIAEGAGAAVLPTPFTVAAEEYPLTYRLYLYTAPSSTNPNVARFVELALGAEGQAAVQRTGHEGLGVRAERVSGGGSPDYTKLTAGARRLTSTFRFEPGTATLDNRALADLDRVVSFLHGKGLDGASVRVIGFADGKGTAALELSRERARLVAQALAQRGVAGVTVAGLGATRPLGDDSSASSRERSRRVELWIVGG